MSAFSSMAVRTMSAKLLSATMMLTPITPLVLDRVGAVVVRKFGIDQSDAGAGNYAYAAFVGDGRGEARERDAHAHAPLDDRERDFQIAYLNAFHLVVRVFICGNMRFMYREKTVPRHLRRVASERFRACRQFHVE